ncbi:hypothetical protein [Kordiimonas aestuarii]|uniref:hypothetical protein n=1 Tax=Kordiimonas aestuarii TaxID=1005925 RepID=UPI0021D2898E|nr:hypothetical protein [Kordiimonas aestuarii]
MALKSLRIVNALKGLSVALLLAVFPAQAVVAQGILALEQDPRQMALDVFSGINRNSPPATVALKLSQLINAYRFRCTRLTDYQVFSARPNMIDVKAKCSGDPLYGVTVASNGYVAVYGGNGMVSPLDRRDGLIVSFAADGRLESDSRVTAGEAFDETVERLELGDDFNLLYVLGLFSVLLAVVTAIAVIWLRMWRTRKGKKRRHRGIKPMAKHAVSASSRVKDQLLKESEQLSRKLYKHPSETYIARGKYGKRRFFKSRFWATTYIRFGWRMFEVSSPEPIGMPDMEGASDVAAPE